MQHVQFAFWCSLFQGFLQAVKEYGDVDVFIANFRPLKATLSGLPDRIFMKLIVCAKTRKVLGLHMCGEDSPEIVQVLSLLRSVFCFHWGKKKIQWSSEIGSSRLHAFN